MPHLLHELCSDHSPFPVVSIPAPGTQALPASPYASRLPFGFHEILYAGSRCPCAYRFRLLKGSNSNAAGIHFHRVASLLRERDYFVGRRLSALAFGSESILAPTNAVEHYFMDLNMPKLNGIEATREIRLPSPDTRTVILTQIGDEDVRGAALSAGAAGYVVKTEMTVALIPAVCFALRIRV